METDFWIPRIQKCSRLVMVLIYFTGEAYRNCLMLVSCHRITERILDKSDRNLFYDHVWSFKGVVQESDSTIYVRFTMTTIFRKIFCTILQDHTRFCFKIMHGRTRILYDLCVWLLAVGSGNYERDDSDDDMVGDDSPATLSFNGRCGSSSNRKVRRPWSWSKIVEKVADTPKKMVRGLRPQQVSDQVRIVWSDSTFLSDIDWTCWIGTVRCSRSECAHWRDWRKCAQMRHSFSAVVHHSEIAVRA